MSFKHKSARRNLFLSEYFCYDFRLSLLEMDQKYKFGGSVDFGDSYLGFLFGHFKVFRQNSPMHDAAGAVRARSGKAPG